MLKEEKVVYPPHTPSMKNCWRNQTGRSHRPSGPVKVAKKPITKDPETLTSSVPQGNVSPKCRATIPDNQKRATLPKAPPKPTQKYASCCTGWKLGVEALRVNRKRGQST